MDPAIVPHGIIVVVDDHVAVALPGLEIGHFGQVTVRRIEPPFVPLPAIDEEALAALHGLLAVPVVHVGLHTGGQVLGMGREEREREEKMGDAHQQGKGAARK